MGKSQNKRWTSDRRAQVRGFVAEAKSVNRQRIEVDSMEFMDLFLVRGGEIHFEPGMYVQAVDRHGRKPGRPVVDRILQIGRDKAAELMRNGDDAAAIRQRREDRREILSQRQMLRRLEAEARKAYLWCREDHMPDQVKRSVLTSTNKIKDPTMGSDGQIVCYKVDDRYYVAAEYWPGTWSAPDADGFRERIDVTLDVLETSFHDEKEAHATINLMAQSGRDIRFGDRQNPRAMQAKAARLREWKVGDVDLKKIYAKPAKVEKKKPKRGKWKRIPVEISVK
jgi:hypothetical protein